MINHTNPLRQLSKTPEQKRFYSSSEWTHTSKWFRQVNPLCNRCRGRDIVQVSQMVHHTTPLQELLDTGQNPHDWTVLEALCNDCHMEDLRAKRGRGGAKVQGEFKRPKGGRKLLQSALYGLNRIVGAH